MYKSKKRIKLNILYIFLFLVFISFFPYLKKTFGNNNQTQNKAVFILVLADRFSESLVTNFSKLRGYFVSQRVLTKQVEELQKELATPRMKFASSRSLNNQLAGQTNQFIVAQKIFSDFTNLYDTLLLNKGSQAGVREGDIVFINESEAIGQISQVSLNTSLVTLFSKSKEKVEGVILTTGSENTSLVESSKNTQAGTQLINGGEEVASSSTTTLRVGGLSTLPIETTSSRVNSRKSNILIDVYGYGGGDFISEIPANISLGEGAKVSLAIDESRLLGEVVKIEKKDASFYQKLFIRGYYNTRENDNYYIDKQ